MKIGLFLITITISINLFGQTKDTLMLYNFKQTILPDNDSSYISTGILNSSIIKDTFYLTIATATTHCNKLEPGYSLDQDTLFLGVSIGDTYCVASYANYYFDFKFSKPKRKYIIKWHGEEIGYVNKQE